MGEKTKGMTMRLAEFISETKTSDIPKDIYEHAKVAFLDWLGVTMGGLDDPLVEKLIDYTVLMGGNEQASLLGRTIKKSLAQAALINGAASHALDYDDSLIPFLGHPSVTLFPGLLALSEWQGKSGADFLTAYIIGLKSGVAIASCAGGEHYLSGYHGTSTMGTLAAASACSRLLGLDKKKTVYALGIAGTQSAGLKRVFGTMCKPFHAGRAAEVGLMAALLAQSGFDSAEDILEGPSGLFAAMKGQVREEVLETLGQTWEIENLAQKYHASCHGTHSAIEASLAIFKKEKLTPDQVKAIRVNQSAVGLSAAFRTEAKTGLEAKFSIPYCVANAVIKNTTGLQAFSQERVNDPEVQAFMPKIKTHEDPDMLALEARVEIETHNGRTISAFSNVFQEIPSLEDKRTKIKAKFVDLAPPILGEEKTRALELKALSLEQVTDMKKVVELTCA